MGEELHLLERDARVEFKDELLRKLAEVGRLPPARVRVEVLELRRARTHTAEVSERWVRRRCGGVLGNVGARREPRAALARTSRAGWPASSDEADTTE